MAENDGMRTPTPDPTKLTTDAVNAAVDISRRELNALEQRIDQRMDGMDHVEKEKVCRLNDKFDTIEALRIEQKNDTKAAVDAALTAQKEAVNKSEASMVAQISALSETFSASFDGMRRDIDDIKGRLTTVEAERAGRVERGGSISSGVQLAIGMLLLAVAVLAVVVTVVLANA